MTVVCCIAGTITFTYADDGKNFGVSQNAPEIQEESSAQLYSTSTPSTDDVYKNNTEYIVYGTADISKLFTDECFYGVNRIYMNLKNYRSDDLTINLRRVEWYGYTKADTDYVPGNCSYGGAFSNLDTSKYYFLEFEAPCSFYGTIEGYN